MLTSRRVFLQGLLSSAAILSAGPIVKCLPVEDNGWVSFTSTFKWEASTIKDWQYIVRIANIDTVNVV